MTDYGKKIKIAVINKDKTQGWLVSEVAHRTGLYFDTSYLNKIMNGKNSNPKIVSAINEILGI
ncbi:MAG: XRE family transcriptional regulator [Clostridia bacterium]|nr:XRE family transcriptional regulator [Clostridia bacterium]